MTSASAQYFPDSESCSGSCSLSLAYLSSDGCKNEDLQELQKFGEAAVDSASVHSEQPSAVSKKRGEVISWRKFAMQVYSSKYLWLDIYSDGTYCKFCVCHSDTARGTSRSGSGMFISEPFTGTWPDALAQHAASDGHSANALSFQQSTEQLVACKQPEDLVAKAQ